MYKKTIVIIYILIFNSIIFITSCVANETVTITKYFGDIRIEKVELPISTEKLEFRIDIRESITKIEGMEKLKNLKYLYIGSGLDDLAFLEKMVNLEILAIIPGRQPLSLDFLKKLKKIRILNLGGVYLETPTINLLNNDQLEFLLLSNIRSSKDKGYFELNIENAPHSLKCIDLATSALIIINEKLLDKIIHVPLILVKNDPIHAGNRFEVSEEYLKKYPNIHTKDFKKLQPKELQRKFFSDLFGVP